MLFKVHNSRMLHKVQTHAAEPGKRRNKGGKAAQRSPPFF